MKIVEIGNLRETRAVVNAECDRLPRCGLIIEASEACKAKNADLDALERACEIVLDGNTLKAVIEAKRRIKEGAAK